LSSFDDLLTNYGVMHLSVLQGFHPDYDYYICCTTNHVIKQMCSTFKVIWWTVIVRQVWVKTNAHFSETLVVIFVMGTSPWGFTGLFSVDLLCLLIILFHAAMHSLKKEWMHIL